MLRVGNGGGAFGPQPGGSPPKADGLRRCMRRAVPRISLEVPAYNHVDLDKVDLRPGAKPMTLRIGVPGNPGGEVSSQFRPAPPFESFAP
jgi:hypothetical protein